MNTLRVFSEKEREYFNYLSRPDVMREQRTTEQVMAKFEGAKSELKRAKSESEKLKAESERLRPAADQREAPLRVETDGLQPNTLRACNETQPAK